MERSAVAARGATGSGRARKGTPRGLACALAVVLLAAAGPGAGEPVRLTAGDVGQGALPVEPQSVRGPGHHGPLVEIELPPLEGDSLALTGLVASRDVHPPGYLEMWVVFPDGSRYFTRSLARRGPLARLEGSSGPRRFVLPFALHPDAKLHPVRVELGVVLPGSGEVELRDLRFETPAPAGPTASFAEGRGWWGPRTSDLIGAVLGTSLGLLGALLGVLASRRRLSPGSVRLVAALLLTGAAASLASGLVALAAGQPRHVWLSLLVFGGVTACVGLVVLHVAWRIGGRPTPFSQPAAPPGGSD